jgi:hypothetical protein
LEVSVEPCKEVIQVLRRRGLDTGESISTVVDVVRNSPDIIVDDSQDGLCLPREFRDLELLDSRLQGRGGARQNETELITVGPDGVIEASELGWKLCLRTLTDTANGRRTGGRGTIAGRPPTGRRPLDTSNKGHAMGETIHEPLDGVL